MPDRSSARAHAVLTANSRQPRRFERILGEDGRPQPVSRIFGSHTFSLKVMEEKLPRPVFERVRACVQDGHPLHPEVADVVAHSVKEWALAQGVTHFTHWFQPMTGSTAEKHDAFLSLRAGAPVERFTGAMLVQSEPDASSFPSGGMRSTFEARGYTAWDPSSPMFVMETAVGKTLCIPSAFVSYTGQALDQKTPLLRSMEALDRQARRLLAAVGEEPRRVVPTLGCEQEYFLVDRAYWALRQDLAINGRTVLGAAPPKGQSLEDHYFGSVPPRVLAFMQEVEQELYKLGVPAKTRHNEVAPGQFELAPIFAEANVAVDHNQMVMDVLQRVALRHEFRAILHEKPFAGVNGSGKHCNWSLQDAHGDNLLEPGTNPHENLRFLAVLASVLLGVWRYNGALRASIAAYSNDFRLGANEAPPAIMSVFVGDLLTHVCDTLTAGQAQRGSVEQQLLGLGVNRLPQLAQDNTDRNRTSPVAFTGNKFEVRAVGSRANPAVPMTALNTMVAEGMAQLSDWIAELGGGDSAVLDAVRRALRESAPVRFEGNNYSAEWVEEAARRGLKNHVTTPQALEELRAPEVVALYDRHGVLTPEELESRYRVQVEQYVHNARIELDILRDLVDTAVLPAALSDLGELVKSLDRFGHSDACAGALHVAQERAARISNGLSQLQAAREVLDHTVAQAEEHGHDAAAWQPVVQALWQVRDAADSLEQVVNDALWPLPKYREMMFLS